MENREPVRAGTLEEYKDKPRFAVEKEKEHLEEELRAVSASRSLSIRPFDYSPPKHKWGMVIDLTTCIGCKACVVACQAENNIPVVGKEQVAAGREMHWLRIDRYISGPYDEPKEFHFQPVPCMHCENAPCEYVCPVEATVHSAEGLNDMIYNRCVGTRFCSNNCPYKVRRFNFFHYADYATPSLRHAVQPRRDGPLARRHGEVHATACSASGTRRSTPRMEDRPIADGEILTACQAACPAQAIVFGDINDRARARSSSGRTRRCTTRLLAELNTEPRTTYLAALRNPNPELGGGVTWPRMQRRHPARTRRHRRVPTSSRATSVPGRAFARSPTRSAPSS